MEIPDAEFAQVGAWEGAGQARAATAILTDPQGRILLQLREAKRGIPYPGTWSTFGGGVEPGETLAGAVRREIAEELGRAPAEFAPFARVLSHLPGRRRVYVFAAEWGWGTEGVRLGEGAGFAFFHPAQIPALPRPPHIAMVLDAWLSRPGPGAERSV